MGDERTLRRLALLIEYEGTAYGGSQYQKNAPTIQGSLERALSSLTGESIRVAMAGRTDAGVHARGQVAAFSTGCRRPLDTVVRGLNALLPGDVAVRAVREVANDFDPRRKAVSRRYRYTIHNAVWRPALLRHTVWQVERPLDIEAMGRSASQLLGRRDFAAFTRPVEAKRKRTERMVSAARIDKTREVLRFDIEGDAFLPQMVRRIMGALVEVGLGKRTEAQFEQLIERAGPGEAAWAAPARGLCLMKVRYENGLFDDETDEDLYA